MGGFWHGFTHIRVARWFNSKSLQQTIVKPTYIHLLTPNPSRAKWSLAVPFSRNFGGATLSIHHQDVKPFSKVVSCFSILNCPKTCPKQLELLKWPVFIQSSTETHCDVARVAQLAPWFLQLRRTPLWEAVNLSARQRRAFVPSAQRRL